MVYGNFQDFSRIVASNKALRDKALDIAKTQNMIDINTVLLQWFILNKY